MQRLHPEFRLNGTSHDAKTLGAAAQVWVNDVDAETHALGIFILEWLSDDTNVSLQTSGSTGTAKQLDIPKASMIESAQRTGTFFELRAGTRPYYVCPYAILLVK